MALRRLENTIEIAERLPNGSGLFLKDLALALLPNVIKDSHSCLASS
jgi:hypothetical protein